MCTGPADSPAEMSVTSQDRSRGFQALGTWLLVYVGATMASVLVLFATGQGQGQDPPMWVLAVNVSAMWAVYLWFLPRLLPFTNGPIRRQWTSWFSGRDVWLGALLGVGSQLVLMNLINWPLSRIFPDQFSAERVTERAESLANAAPGAWVALLILVVVVGAPVVEEIVYRGCLQTSLVGGFGAGTGVVVTAALFALIHWAPVEFPGLFAFALVLGWARHRTGSLGLAIVTHVAFNATGLTLVLSL